VGVGLTVVVVAPGVGVGRGVDRGRFVGVGVGVGVGCGFGVGFGVGVGLGGGAAIVTVPADNVASLLSFALAWITTSCRPWATVPDHRNVTPLPQDPVASRTISWVAESNDTLTLSARDPLAFW
jgi:hypothetical protein